MEFYINYNRFDSQSCGMVASFFRDRFFRIKVGLVLAAVPQGSLLGPILYNIFCCDIPDPAPGVPLLTLANDILLAFFRSLGVLTSNSMPAIGT